MEKITLTKKSTKKAPIYWPALADGQWFVFDCNLPYATNSAQYFHRRTRKGYFDGADLVEYTGNVSTGVKVIPVTLESISFSYED